MLNATTQRTALSIVALWRAWSNKSLMLNLWLFSFRCATPRWIENPLFMERHVWWWWWQTGSEGRNLGGEEKYTKECFIPWGKIGYAGWVSVLWLASSDTRFQDVYADACGCVCVYANIPTKALFRSTVHARRRKAMHKFPTAKTMPTQCVLHVWQ